MLFHVLELLSQNLNRARDKLELNKIRLVNALLHLAALDHVLDVPKRALNAANYATGLLFPLSLLALCHVFEQLLCQGKLSEGQAVEWDMDLRRLCLHLPLCIL